MSSSLHDMLFIINISWIGLAPGELTASSLMVLGCDWPVPLEPSTELGRRSWVGSGVQAEVPGAMVVSLSSDLDYLLWATTLFSSIFVVLYGFKVLLVFFSFFWVSCRFDQTVYEDFLYFFSDVAAHFPLFDYPFYVIF